MDITLRPWGMHMGHGSSEEVAQATMVIVLQLENENDVLHSTPTLALQNGHTKRNSQTGKPIWTQREPGVSIPPLDALIIPKAVHECKTIDNLLADLSDVFLFTTLYHTFASSTSRQYRSLFLAEVCYNKGMDMRDISEVVSRLRVRLETPERAQALAETLLALPQPRPRHAAVLVALFERDAQTHLLFIRRASTLRSHSGEIAFPGGAIDASDASPTLAALREAQEEIGLDPCLVEVLGVLPPVFTQVSNFLIIPVVAHLSQGLGMLQAQVSEVDEIIFTALAGLADPLIAHTEEWIRDGEPRTIYFYDYGSYRIWGATARILNDLLQLLAP